jgi:hypothetical protein
MSFFGLLLVLIYDLSVFWVFFGMIFTHAQNKILKAKKQLAKTSNFSGGLVKDFRGTELLSRFFFS